MRSFVVAIPLFDSNMTVEAYRLCDHNADRLLGTASSFQSMGDALLSYGADLVESVGLEPFTGGKPLFIDTNQYLLMMDVLLRLKVEPAKIVCVLPRNMPADDRVLGKCVQLREMGYSFATGGIPYTPQSAPLYDLSDFMIVDMSQPDFGGQLLMLRKLTSNKRLVIENVPDHASFERVKNVDKALYSGQFYNQPLTRGVSQVSPVKANALHLLKMVNEEDFDLRQVARIVERDPSISISLLRFINSPAVATRRRIESISSAVAILGQREFRTWVMVAVSVQLAEDRPNEITKLSLVRAKFAENLATAYELGTHAASLFMTGLFSLLDVILEKPMDQALQELLVSDEVAECLVERKGRLFAVMQLIYAYERGDWDTVSINMIRNRVDVEAIARAFVDALIWYRDLLQEVSDVSTEA